jgi:thiamine-monophosphate kinase
LERLAQGNIDDAATRHLWPTARLALGRRLRELGVRSALDISDGLSTDLNRLAEASSVRIQIHFEDLPRFHGASDSQVLHGGEEYELLFSAPASAKIPRSFEGVPLTQIGTATSGNGVTLVREGLDSVLAPGGFEHLVGDG